MTRVCEAVFDNGVFRPTGPLQLRQGQRVEVVIPSANPEVPLRTADHAVLLSEDTMSRVWGSEEEDQAWADL